MPRNILICLILPILCSCVAHWQPQEWTYGAQARYAENMDYLEPRFQSAEANVSEVMFLCDAYLKLYEYEKLTICLDRLQHMIDSGDNSIMGSNIAIRPYSYRSEMLIELGEFSKAADIAEKGYAIGLAEDVHRMYLIEVIGLYGLAYALQDNRPGADKAISQLNDMYLGYPYDMLEENRDRELARIYFALGEYGKAAEASSKSYTFSLTKAVASMAAGTGDIFLFSELPYLYIKNKSMFETGRLQEAKVGYDKLLELPQISNSGAIYWNTLYDRGRIAESENDLATAKTYYAKAIQAIELKRASVGNEASRIGYSGSKQRVYASMIALLVALGDDAEGLEYAERAKARALVDMLTQRSRFTPKPESAERQQEILDKLRQAELAYYRTDQRETVEDKARQRNAILSIRQQLSREYPQLSSIATVETITPEEIQSQLATGEALVEYFIHADLMYAFYADKQKIRAVKLNAKGLDKDIRRFRQAIIARSGEASAIGRRLYSRLITPLSLTEQKRLLIVPHGGLHYLPFNALMGKEGYLIDMATIRLLPSASVMRFLSQRRTAPEQELLLLGNPNLGNPDLDLAGAETEVREIRKTWPESTALLRKEASKQALEEAGHLFRMIHIAAHGQFHSDSPLDSAILLAPASGDDGKLTVGDLYTMELDADMVTLSACETGMGDVKGGDDVIGLNRGFLYAGVRSLVASLWQVPDRETTFLMIEFYRNLKTMNRVDALRQAQLTTRERFPAPYFWAPFQLTGNGN